jgi:adenosylcobyric acid synthase
MFLGTGSDAGKSVIAAGFCRILYKRGISVAPFKSQNMALNSFVTMDGKEMGRAQVFQASAAGLLPDADMNPVLLKPSRVFQTQRSQTQGSQTQVILQGKLLVTDTASGYYRMKDLIFKRVLESYGRLSRKYEALVLEGAGSLTEINLKHADIANMEMAMAAGAPVVVVADIDRGGVFASLVGTMKLLTRREKKLVIGFIINKFRGSMDLFYDGLRLIEKLTRRPVFGIVPYFDDIHLPEEDSVALQSGKKGRRMKGAKVRISVISLPHISNYTDFDPFELERDVSIWYSRTPDEIDDASIVILPGTKNTIEDLNWLRERGFFPALRHHVKRGRSLIGICGGYQMLGTAIEDPHGVESSRGHTEGMGFLPVSTILETEKTLSRVSGFCTLDGMNHVGDQNIPVEGYEIHMGKTTGFETHVCPFTITSRDGNRLEYGDGAVSHGNRVWGTYLHGLFENDLFREQFLSHHGRKGCSKLSYRAFLDEQFDKLADLIERNVDVERILRCARRFM